MTEDSIEVPLEREVGVAEAVDLISKVLDCNRTIERPTGRYEDIIIYNYWLGRMAAPTQKLEAAYQLSCRGVVQIEPNSPKTAYHYTLQTLVGESPSAKKRGEIILGLRNLH